MNNMFMSCLSTNKIPHSTEQDIKTIKKNVDIMSSHQ